MLSGIEMEVRPGNSGKSGKWYILVIPSSITSVFIFALIDLIVSHVINCPFPNIVTLSLLSLSIRQNKSLCIGNQDEESTPLFTLTEVFPSLTWLIPFSSQYFSAADPLDVWITRELLHPSNTLLPNPSTLSGMLMEESEVHPLNA